MPLLVLRGKAALVALRNSAIALRDDAFTLIRSTEPENPERITGSPSDHTPRSTGRTHAGLRGVTEMGRDHAQWVTWKLGIIGLIKDEPMQRAVAQYIDTLIKAGNELVNASVSAKGTTHSPWADHYNDLNHAINDLDQALPHIPVDTKPVEPQILVSLVRRLVGQNGKIGLPHDDGSIDSHGYPDSMEAELRGQTWGKEMAECSTRYAFWLDRTTTETTVQRTTWSQQAMATLFELSIAVRMMDRCAAADEVVAAHQAVLDQAYWRVECTEQWEERTGRTADVGVRFPLMATAQPIGHNVLERLDHAVARYAEVPEALRPDTGEKGLSPNQLAIWDSLKGTCKNQARLVAEGCGKSTAQIGNDINHIRARKGAEAIKLKRGFGYYRPDAPPDWAHVPVAPRQRPRRST